MVYTPRRQTSAGARRSPFQFSGNKQEKAPGKSRRLFATARVLFNFSNPTCCFYVGNSGLQPISRILERFSGFLEKAEPPAV
jgi:hypothetical protein